MTNHSPSFFPTDEHFRSLFPSPGTVSTGHRAAMVNVALRALLDAQEHREAQLQADRVFLESLGETGLQ